MALTRTLTELRDPIRRTADVLQFTDRHPDSQIDDLANRGIGALNRVTSIVAPNFRPLGSTTIPADGINTLFGLPADCRSVLSVEYTGEQKKKWLVPFDLNERAELLSADAVTPGMASTRATNYAVIGSNIELLPRPPLGHTVFIWYATTAQQLSGPGDSIDVYDRLDDYIIWWAAREIAKDRKEWQLHQVLTNDLAALESQIQIVARQRDLSGPSRPRDVYVRDQYGRTVRR